MPCSDRGRAIAVFSVRTPTGSARPGVVLNDFRPTAAPYVCPLAADPLDDGWDSLPLGHRALRPDGPVLRGLVRRRCLVLGHGARSPARRAFELEPRGARAVPAANGGLRPV